MAFWQRIRSMWAAHEQHLAINELKREVAEAGATPLPHTGGALFDEPLHPQPIEEVPGDDFPDAPPA
jgi:hypothetical protein